MHIYFLASAKQQGYRLFETLRERQCLKKTVLFLINKRMAVLVLILLVFKSCVIINNAANTDSTEEYVPEYFPTVNPTANLSFLTSSRMA